MFEARKPTAVPRKDSVGAPARPGRPGVPGDRTRPRWQWVLIALVAVLSAGLGTAIDISLRGRIADGEALGPTPSRAPGVVPPTAAVDLASGLAAPPAPGSPKPEEGGPGAGDGEIKDTRPADDEPHPPVAGPAGPPRPVEDAPQPAADPVALGRVLFARTWRPDDPRCHGGDGLGPVYNAASCLDCHSLGGPGGAGPVEQNVELVTGIGYILSPQSPIPIAGQPFAEKQGLDMVITDPDQADLVSIHPDFRDATSIVLHRFGVEPDYSQWRATFRSRSRPLPALPTFSSSRSSRGRATPRSPSRKQRAVIPEGITYLADRRCRLFTPVTAGDRAIVRTFLDEIGAKDVAIGITARNPPPLFGTGLIDGLADTELESVARQQPPSIRGRVHRLKDGRIGRFGWRAEVASLEDFVLNACANELGLEVPGHHQAASPLDPAAKAKSLDLTQDECNALVDYVRSLPAPDVLAPSGAQGSAAVEGRRLFQSVGCASCHIPDLGSVRGIYSDLLLHDMGEELSGAGNYGTEDSASHDQLKRGEWRTPPLWGLRDSAPYLHDGRALSLEQAVALHGGQGAASVYRFRALGPGQKSKVLAFLNSLTAPGRATAP